MVLRKKKYIFLLPDSGSPLNPDLLFIHVVFVRFSLYPKIPKNRRVQGKTLPGICKVNYQWSAEVLTCDPKLKQFLITWSFSLPQSNVVLTFKKSVDEILWCDPFKWNLFGSSLSPYHLFFNILQNEILESFLNFIFLALLGMEGLSFLRCWSSMHCIFNLYSPLDTFLVIVPLHFKHFFIRAAQSSE